MRRSLPVFETTSEPLDHRIAIALHKLGLAMKQQTWLLASGEGLSPTQGQILSVLSLEGPKNGTELSAKLGVTLPTISDSVRALAEKELVAKKRDPRHPRASLIALTAAGRARAAKARTWPDFLAAATSPLSESEQEVFLGALMKMICMLQESGQVPTNRMCATCTYFRPNVHDGRLPHHCAFVDSPMATKDLRLDCPDHNEADEADRAQILKRFTRAA